MTVPAQDTRVTYTASGSSDTFAYPFLIQSNADLLVYVDEVEQTLTTDYTVTGVGTETGGNVVFTSAPAADSTVVILRNMAYERTAYDYQNAGDFKAETINADLDAVVMQIQQLKEMLDRVPMFSVSSTLADILFPQPGAGQFIRWNNAGTDLETAPAVYDLGTFLQSGTGAVERTAASKMGEIISVTDYDGVDPIGVVDSTAGLQAAIDYAASIQARVVARGTFRISSKLVIKCDADFSQATLNVYATPAVAVEISTGNATNPTTEISNTVIWLPRAVNNMTKPATGWAGQGVGVRIVSAYCTEVHVGEIQGFATGLLVTAYNTNGSVQNNIHLGNLNNNRVNVALTPGDTTSWVNENNFIGGRYNHLSSEGSNVTGVRHILLSKSNHIVNNNLFLKPSIEGDTPQYHVENGGCANTIIQGRWEASPPKVLYTSDNSGQAVDNVILGGYGAQSIAFTFVGATGGNYNKVLHVRDNNCDSGTSTTGIHKMMNAGSSSYPIHTYYEASTTYRPESAGAGDWAMRHSAEGLQGKRRTDTYARIRADYVNGRLYVGNGAADATAYIGAFGTSFASFGTWYPGADNTHALGSGDYRWSVVYAGTGVINTSDAREKQDVAPLDDAEKRVAATLKGLIRKYRFIDAVDKLGDAAPIHVGVIAQEVIAAFAGEGLDAMRYGIVCADEIAGGSERYGLRYDQLFAFIVSAL